MNAFVHAPTIPAERVMALLPGEIALAHVLMMRTAGLANGLLDRAAVAPDNASEVKGSLAAAGLAGLSARLMQRFVDGSSALRLLRSQGVRPADDARAGPTAAALPAALARPAAPKYHAAPGLARGRLRNGNPSGDFLAAPRCAARTREGRCCRQPGMANGRCRFHGGKSTGARTPAGLARCRAARLVHGGRAGAVIRLRSQACHSARRLRHLTLVLRKRTPAARTVAAGYRVDRSDLIRTAWLLRPAPGITCRT